MTPRPRTRVVVNKIQYQSQSHNNFIQYELENTEEYLKNLPPIRKKRVLTRIQIFFSKTDSWQKVAVSMSTIESSSRTCTLFEYDLFTINFYKKHAFT